MSSDIPDPNEIMELERQAFRLFQAGDIDRMIDTLIAPDGLLFADGGAIVAGGEAQRALFKEFVGAGHALEFGPTQAFVSRSADMAWAHGSYELKTPEGARDVGKRISIWVKDEHGAWKNIAETRTSNGAST